MTVLEIILIIMLIIEMIEIRMLNARAKRIDARMNEYFPQGGNLGDFFAHAFMKVLKEHPKLLSGALSEGVDQYFKKLNSEDNKESVQSLMNVVAAATHVFILEYRRGIEALKKEIKESVGIKLKKNHPLKGAEDRINAIGDKLLQKVESAVDKSAEKIEKKVDEFAFGAT